MARPRTDTVDRATGILNRRDALVYFAPTLVPLAMALTGRMDLPVLTWLIWLELLPRGVLLAVEMVADHRRIGTGPVTVVLVAVGMTLAGMAFIGAFLHPIREDFGALFENLITVSNGDRNWWSGAFEPFVDRLLAGGLAPALLVAIAARAWRAWEIDWQRDPQLQHLHRNSAERKQRRQESLVLLVLWMIVADGRVLHFIDGLSPYVAAVLATAVYCLAPIVLAWQRGPLWPVGRR